MPAVVALRAEMTQALRTLNYGANSSLATEPARWQLHMAAGQYLESLAARLTLLEDAVARIEKAVSHAR